jgi:DNA-binding CsgD family transcriptional regulator
MTIIYIATTFFAFLLLIGYHFGIKKKQPWFYVLYTAVLVVNIGYLTLAMADTLDTALWANRISYLGSVFLPLSMLKAIQKISKLKYPKWLSPVLIGISAVVFFIAASPGWFNIYYKSVTLEMVDGVAVLNKEYGPWHSIYLFYLVGYFVTMLATAIHAVIKKKIESTSHAVIVLVAVFVNICVWLIEQLVKFDFEFLSVSYIITEIFLLSIYLVIQTQERIIETLKAQNANQPAPETDDLTKGSQEFLEHCKFIIEQLPTLTTREKELYELFTAGKSTKEILLELDIKENTLKFHSKNLYSKLGVSTRKQLIEYARAINASKVK